MTILAGKITYAQYLPPPYKVVCSHKVIRDFAKASGAKQEVKLVEGGAHFCMACFQQYIKPDQKFIDFSATWDGGTFRGKDGQLVSVADLILCSGCVEQAARLLGMDYVAEVEKKATEWEKKYKA